MRTALLVISVLTAAGRHIGVQEPSYRFERRVDAVAVDVAVTLDGRPLDGLAAADFEIRDNGVLQDIEQIQVETAPVDAILVLDSSTSVAGHELEELRAAVKSFVAGLRAKDRVALLTFSDYVRLWQVLTVDRELVLYALDGIVAGGNTALRDGLYSGLSLTGPPAIRPVVVLFSDGLDNTSLISESELHGVVRESNAVVYVVRGSRPPPEARYSVNQPRTTVPAGEKDPFFWRGPVAVPADNQREKFLRRVVDDSGGRFFEIDDASSMEEEFRRVVEDIGSRYLLTYYPTGVAEDGWHDLDVRLKNRKADVRARRGFHFSLLRE